jgi:hypothetical protein
MLASSDSSFREGRPWLHRICIDMHGRHMHARRRCCRPDRHCRNDGLALWVSASLFSVLLQLFSGFWVLQATPRWSFCFFFQRLFALGASLPHFRISMTHFGQLKMVCVGRLKQSGENLNLNYCIRKRICPSCLFVQPRFIFFGLSSVGTSLFCFTAYCTTLDCEFDLKQSFSSVLILLLRSVLTDDNRAFFGLVDTTLNEVLLFG